MRAANGSTCVLRQSARGASSVNLERLLVLFMFSALVSLAFVSADTRSWDSQAKMIGGSLSSIQVNIDPATDCDANRYISTGYAYPSTDTNPSGTCNRCNGVGGIQNVPNNEDTFGDCPGSFGSCAGSYCNGGGACQFKTAGQQSCGTCRYCTGGQYACANVANGLDTYGNCPGSVGTCAGANCNGNGNCQYLDYGKQGCSTCKYCSGGSYTCSNVAYGQDTFSDCPGSLGTCAADFCNGVGNCYYLSSGKQGCPTCKYCTGSSFSCASVTTNTDPYNDCAVSGCQIGTCGSSGCATYYWRLVQPYAYTFNETLVGPYITCGSGTLGSWAYTSGHQTGTKACGSSMSRGISYTPGGIEVTEYICSESYS